MASALIEIAIFEVVVVPDSPHVNQSRTIFDSYRIVLADEKWFRCVEELIHTVDWDSTRQVVEDHAAPR